MKKNIKKNIKKLNKNLISLILIFWISLNFLFSSKIFADNDIKNFVNPQEFSQFLENIWENNISDKSLKKFIKRKDVWKISLEMAWFHPKNKDFINYIREVFNKKILFKNWEGKNLNPNLNAKKYETLEFLFKILWVNTPFFNDQIMDFADVENDDPVVSKCLELRVCKWKNDKIFWKNSPITRLEFYEYLVKIYSISHQKTQNNLNNKNFSDLSESDKKFQILQNIFNTIKTSYYKIWEINKDDLVYWAAKWMAEAVWDKYTKFFPPVKSKNFNQALNWNFEWIWAYIEHDNEWIKIVTPMNGSPAKKAWLKPWDVILEADWKVLKKYSIQEWVALIKWKSWTFVGLKIKRWNSILNFKIKRWKVLVPSVESKILDDNDILYIKINQFWARTDKELFQVLEENDSKNKIIFDLRNNPWGYLEVAKNILSMFIDAW